MSVIVTLSGGKASAWCANWAFENYSKWEIILYFNDTKWEHPDLYRFLDDLEVYFDHPIVRDSDGRSPEDLCVQKKALANDRRPFCSDILKAKRLQKFYKFGDTLVFGIGCQEKHRAQRIVHRYFYDVQVKTGKMCRFKFPLIINKVGEAEVNKFFMDAGIRLPLLYRLGFKHNNCSGGCVRSGKATWKRLYLELPEVYLERERVEEMVRNKLGKNVSFLRNGLTLRKLRENLDAVDIDDIEDFEGECIGVCSSLA